VARSVVFLVLEAQERGEPKIISIHRQSGVASSKCSGLNEGCNPDNLDGFDNFYVRMAPLEK